MQAFLLFIHLALCIAAIIWGTTVVSDLFSRCFSRRRVVLFLRCSLGSNIAAIFLQFQPLLLPSQKLALVSVYGAGAAILAWRRFHLQGAWRSAFAFTLALLLYLNVVALSIQLFAHDGLVVELRPALFRAILIAASAFFLALSAAATLRFAGTRPRPRGWHTSLIKESDSHRHAVR